MKKKNNLKIIKVAGEVAQQLRTRSALTDPHSVPSTQVGQFATACGPSERL